MGCLYQIAIAMLLVLTGCEVAGSGAPPRGREYTAFANPERVTIRGYSGHAMEPFITRDGRYLFFNNSNEYAACISSDELELFFTRFENKGFAIYRAGRKTVAQPFDLPERLVGIKGFVEAPTLTADGKSLYYHKKEGELFVIYRVTRSP